MTEQEWLNCTDPTPMLKFFEGRASDRKMRLFACACAREVETGTRRLVRFSVPELAERYADVQAEVIEIVDASAEVQDAAYLQTYAVGAASGVLEAALDLKSYQAATQAAMWLNGYYSDDSTFRLRPTTFCRDIFGNPSVPSPLNALGLRQMSSLSHTASTPTVPLTECRFWQMLFRMPGATIRTS